MDHRHPQWRRLNPAFSSRARAVILGGSIIIRTARLLAEFTDNIRFTPTPVTVGTPSMLDSFSALDRFAGVGKWFLRPMRTSSPVGRT